MIRNTCLKNIEWHRQKQIEKQAYTDRDKDKDTERCDVRDRLSKRDSNRNKTYRETDKQAY